MSCRLATAFLGLAAPAVLAAALPVAAQAQAMDMVDIPAGRFVMGACLPPSPQDPLVGQAAACSRPDPEARSDEKPQRSVQIQAFQMGKTPVTLGQFKRYIHAAGRDDLLTGHFMKYNAEGDAAPVVMVSWHDAQDFIRWLNQTQGGGWRLPTEAEWEYACRAGGRHRHCGSDDLNAVAWYWDNSGRRQRPVAQKAPNAFGLYDMTGNVYEWVQDCYADSYLGAPADGSAREGGQRCERRVARGGSFDSVGGNARAAARLNFAPDVRVDDFGFRLARTVSP